MKKLLGSSLSLLFALLFVPSFAAAGGILDLGQHGEFIYQQIKTRGVAATLIALDGNKAVAGALKYGLLHNGAKTEYYAAITLGIEGEFLADGGFKGRFHMATPINLIDVSKRLWRMPWFTDHVDLVKFPEDWELWVGPFVRAPTQNGEHWMWKSHTGVFLSLGKKYGGK